MIKKFDKDGAIALYKREFGKCLESDDFEGAMDNLIKYSQATDNPDFHMTCGMLYLLMSQESDEEELPVLAYREFLMHIQANRDCYAAYRNALAAVSLKHASFVFSDIGEWAQSRGIDVDNIIDELAEIGLGIVYDDFGFVDFRALFQAGEFGAIYPTPANAKKTGATGHPSGEYPSPFDDGLINADGHSNVIKFRGASDDAKGVDSDTTGDKILPMFENDLVDKLSAANDAMDIMLKLAENDESPNEKELGDLKNLWERLTAGDENDPSIDETRSQLIISEAEHHCEKGEYQKALNTLKRIPRDGGRLQYCAECARAHVYFEMSDIRSAASALDMARAIYPRGALVATMTCRLYEMQERFSEIPDVLKNTEVFDYADRDHIHTALMYTVKYCNDDDALELVSEYAEEFNSLDTRLIWAQLLYNSGDRDAAVKELHNLSAAYYDDIHVRYYYSLAKSNVKELPVGTEMPDRVLNDSVEIFIADVNSPQFSSNDKMISTEQFDYLLEMFISLEFRNSSRALKAMFGTLRVLAADKRLRTKMLNALVSPYVESLIKATILEELLVDGVTDFVADMSFNPISSDTMPALNKSFSRGYYCAYALTAILCKRAVPTLVRFAKKVKRAIADRNYEERDIANFLWHNVKTFVGDYNEKVDDDRMHYMLGYGSKQAMATALRKMKEEIDVEPLPAPKPLRLRKKKTSE